MTIADNIARVHDRMRDAEARAGRSEGSATLMLAAKYQPVEALVEAVNAGANTFGHNIIQQLIDAEEGLGAANVGEHRTAVIGHVQSNKLSAAMERAWRIDSVDSLKTAERINRRRATSVEEGAANGPYPVLLQVNSAGAESQFGARPEDVLELAHRMSELDFVRIEGLMTIGANSENEADIHRSFALTRELGEQIRKIDGLEYATELSMGMTSDLEIAITEGSTMIRVGTAVFGPRPRP